MFVNTYIIIHVCLGATITPSINILSLLLRLVNGLSYANVFTSTMAIVDTRSRIGIAGAIIAMDYSPFDMYRSIDAVRRDGKQWSTKNCLLTVSHTRLMM